jgi:signal transduction histidine kinase
MAISSKVRLSLTHFLLALLVLSTADVLAYRAAEWALFRQIQTETLQQIYAATTGVAKLDRPEDNAVLANALAQAVNGRVMILNGLGRVLADSLGEGSLTDKVLSIDEIPPALAGESASSLYRLEGRGRFLYAAVPIEISRKVEGIALAVVSLVPLDRRLARLVPEIITASLVLIAVLALVSVVAGVAMGTPLARLVRAFEAGPAAGFRHRLPARGRSEMAALARVYNTMADRLQRTERARRDFVVEASNELEMPLRQIMDLVDNEEIAVAERLSAVRTLARATSLTVEELLDLARLEMDTGPLKPAPVDFCVVVEEAIRADQPDASLGVQVKRDDKIDTPVMMEGDHRRLVAAVSGLIRYSVAAAEPGAIVRVALSEDARDVLFTVTGSTRALPPEELPFIFERFITRRSVSRVDFLPEKAGAGLAIARRVLELHGGMIEAKSAPSGGIAFFARVPKEMVKSRADI